MSWPDDYIDKIICADVMDYLKSLPDCCVQTCITSPPYWGLRDYGVDGQLGLESTPEEYVEKMVAVFREARRVLRDDGTLWLNLGDSYAGGGRACDTDKQRSNKGTINMPPSTRLLTLKPKDLCGIPWRVAFALQADGWWLRSDIIWSKPNPMPESVTDRPAKAHEYMFLLAKSAKYYFDQEAVREPCESGPSDIKKMLEGKERIGGKHKVLVDPFSKASSVTNIGQKRSVGDPSGRNIRTVWSIATQPFSEAHYATYPERLVEPCIKAGTSEYGCCPECGAPWERVVEREYVKSPVHGEGSVTGRHYDTGQNNWDGYPRVNAKVNTLGWQPTCSHNLDPEPCIVLDPFMGSGTTALVAVKLRRHFIGCDLDPENISMAERRLSEVQVKLL